MGDRDYGKAVMGYFVAGLIALVCTEIIAQAGWSYIAGFGFIVSVMLFVCGTGLFVWQQNKEEKKEDPRAPTAKEEELGRAARLYERRLMWVLKRVFIRPDGSIHFPVQNSRIDASAYRTSCDSIDLFLAQEAQEKADE